VAGDVLLVIRHTSLFLKLTQTCPHKTCPRKSGEWGKDVFTGIL